MASIEVIGSDSSTVTARLVFDAQELDTAKNEAAASLGKGMTIAPHPRGAAPPEALYAKLGEGIFVQSAADSLFRRHAAEQLMSIGLVANGPSRLCSGHEKTSHKKHIGLIDSGQLVIDFQFSPRPLPDAAAILANTFVYEPSTPQEYIDAKIESLRESVADIRDAGRPAQEGDVVVLAIDIFVDGNSKPTESFPLVPMRIDSRQSVLLGSPTSMLLGLVADQSGELTTTYPAELQIDTLAGKAARVCYRVLRVEEHIVPPADDDFAKSCGMSDMAEMRAKLTKQWQKENPNIEYEDRRYAVLTGIVKLAGREIGAEGEDEYINSALTSVFLHKKLTFSDDDYLAVAARKTTFGNTPEQTLLAGLKTTKGYKTFLRLEATVDWLVKNAKY